jgi:hypothetical protein
VTADSDFYELATTIGPPPKVACLRRWTHPTRDGRSYCDRMLSGSRNLPRSYQGPCKRLVAKGIDSSFIAPRTGHFLQVAPIESAPARMLFPSWEDLGPRHSR